MNILGKTKLWITIAAINIIVSLVVTYIIKYIKKGIL